MANNNATERTRIEQPEIMLQSSIDLLKAHNVEDEENQSKKKRDKNIDNVFHQVSEVIRDGGEREEGS